MTTPVEYIVGRQNAWVRRLCPFCGQRAQTYWMSILSTYTLSCAACGEVVEAFELYATADGTLYTENHEIARSLTPDTSVPTWERLS